MKLIIKIAIVFICASSILIAQQNDIKTLINQRSIELDAVQTNKGTFVATIMTTKIETGPIDSKNYIFRSTNNGLTWDSVFVLNADAEFTQSADPVLCKDSMDNIYLVLMRLNRNAHPSYSLLKCYISIDDGLNWNLVGTPFSNTSQFSDFPNICYSNDKLFISYTNYVNSWPIEFVSSTNSGIAWSQPSIVSTIPYSCVGSDINFSSDNTLHIAYSSYSTSSVYHIFSKDLGKSWSPTNEIQTLDNFLINKIISNTGFSYLGIISHEPHNTNTNIYFSHSTDNGKDWTNKTIAKNSSYAEGVLDNSGIYHIAYSSSKNNIFSLNYIFSKDKGETFSEPVIIFENPKSNINYSSGEYQSLILAKDGCFHLTFVDYSDTLKAKQIIFKPLLSDVELVEKSDFIQIYPNPATSYIYIKNDSNENIQDISIYDINGKLVKAFKLNQSTELIDVSDLPSAEYIGIIKTYNRVFVNKITINR